MSLRKSGFFKKSFGLKRCDTITFHCFSNMIFDSPTLETVIFVGSFHFQFSIFRVFGFWTLLDCHLIVWQYGFGIAHRYASNVKPSWETQNYLFWCEFAKSRFFKLFLGFRHCKISIQVLLIAVFGLAGFY